jgi:type II secretory pathway pseudopilin PulG
VESVAPVAAQVPRQQSQVPAHPYAVSAGAVGPAGLRGPYVYHSQPGRSTGANVLIGIAAAVGVLLVVGILAAIAIPVFLNQRAKSASPSTISLPATAAGLVRSDQPDTNGTIEKWLSAPVPGSKLGAYYDTAAGRRQALVLISRLRVSPSDQSDFVSGTENAAAKLGVTHFHSVDTGAAGGQLRCGRNPTGGGTVCGFAAQDMVANINVVGGTGNGDAVAVRLLAAIQRPAS